MQQSVTLSFTLTVNTGGSRLLAAADFAYLGAIRLPAPTADTYFGFAPARVAFDPGDGGLFVGCKVGASGGQGVCKLALPAPVNSPNVADLNRAGLAIGGKPIFGSLLNDSLGGLHVHGGRLLWDTFIYYDAATSMVDSHAWTSLDLTQTSTSRFRVGSLYPGKVAGPMCDVPASYRAAFGAPCLTGRGGGNIISNSNDGPAAVAFDPASLGPAPSPATPFITYGQGQFEPRSGTDGDGPDLAWTWANYLAGTFFTDRGGTRCLGFVCWRGRGIFWYGEPSDGGTCDESDPGPSCFPGAIPDTWNGGKGGHAPPYALSVYLYDPDAVLVCAASSTMPTPYAVLDLPYPFPQGAQGEQYLPPLGATFDQATGRLFVVLNNVDNYFLDPIPVVLVYQLP